VTKAILQPFSEQRLGDVIKEALNKQDKEWHSFQAAVAFAKRSGVAHIQNELQSFIDQGGHVRMVIGIDQHGTSIEALSDLLSISGSNFSP
jgi:HKD family nuclease